MKRVFIGVVIFTSILAYPAFAETSIKAEVDKTSLATGEVLTYKITITSSEKKIPPPQLPEVKGFSVISQLESSSFNLAEGKPKTVLTYIFLLMPLEAGDLVIGPATIKSGDHTSSTQAFNIKVSQGKGLPPQSRPQERPPFPESGNELPQFNL